MSKLWTSLVKNVSLQETLYRTERVGFRDRSWGGRYTFVTVQEIVTLLLRETGIIILYTLMKLKEENFSPTPDC